MRGLLIFIGISCLGALGWWLGSFVGLGTAFLLSSAGSVGGVYVGWRVHRDYFE